MNALSELGVLAFAVLTYINAPANLGRIVGSPMAVGALCTALLAATVLWHVVLRRRRPLVDVPFLLICVFLATALLSTALGSYPTTSLNWIVTFIIEGVLLYWLLLNAIRDLSVFKHVVWVLLIAAAFLSVLPAYQQLAGNYSNDFWGLAQRNLEGSADRAVGPVGDANRFGQNLVVLLPLAFVLARGSQRKPRVLLAAACIIAIVGGILLTQSRGTFLNTVVVLVALVLLRCVPARTMVAAAAVGATIVVSTPGALDRIVSIRGVEDLVSESSEVEADGATRGRMTEMLAALHVALDHPVLGVGPGAYTPHYSVEYMSDPSIAFRSIDTPRRAHTLYFEMAAELGIVGTIAFLLIPLTLAIRLWRIRTLWLRRDRERATLASALLISLFAYFGTAVFLHLSYQRYYWFLMGLAGAGAQVLRFGGAQPAGALRTNP